MGHVSIHGTPEPLPFQLQELARDIGPYRGEGRWYIIERFATLKGAITALQAMLPSPRQLRVHITPDGAHEAIQAAYHRALDDVRRMLDYQKQNYGCVILPQMERALEERGRAETSQPEEPYPTRKDPHSG